MLVTSALWTRGKGLSYQALSIPVKLLPQQYFVAVSPQINVRENEWLQVFTPVLTCHLDYYLNLCKVACNSLSYAVALLFPGHEEFCCSLSTTKHIGCCSV